VRSGRHLNPEARLSLPVHAMDRQSRGEGILTPLLGIDASFGAPGGIVLAGSGGFRTTSTAIPATLKRGGARVAPAPSDEVVPTVAGTVLKVRRRRVSVAQNFLTIG